MSVDIVTPTQIQLEQAEAQIRHIAEVKRRVRNSPYIPCEPTFKQWCFLADSHREVFYGGSAGGAKSWALLMAALLYVDTPGYNALILRRTFRDLSLPGALMDVAQEWLGPTDAQRKDDGKKWIFPSGATLTFGYLETMKDQFQYQGAQFQAVLWDELSQFAEPQYRYLFSRQRQPKSANRVPLRMLSAGNPGGVGHAWVHARFIKSRPPQRQFIPSSLADNPHLDTEEYRRSLAELDPVTRAQLEHGDWEIRPEGNFFTVSRLGYRTLTATEADLSRSWPRVRVWDFAASEQITADESVGVRIAYDPLRKRYLVEDVVRGRWEPGALEAVVTETAARDGAGVNIGIEQEPGASGKMVIRDYRTRVLSGYPVYALPPSGSKIERARLEAAKVHNGDVDLVPASWNSAFIEDHRAFPGTQGTSAGSPDTVDATAHAFHLLARMVGSVGQMDTSAVEAFAAIPTLEPTPSRAASGVPQPGNGPWSSGVGSGSPFGGGGFGRR